MAKRIVLLFVLFLFFATLHAQNKSSTLLKQVADEYWQHELDESLYLRIKFGLPITDLPDPTLEDAKREAAFCNNILDKLKGVDPKEIDHEEFLSLEILKWECAQVVDLVRYFKFTSPITPYASDLSTIHQAFTTFAVNSEEDAEKYVALLKKLPVYVQQLHTTVERQAKEGVLVPKDELEIVIPFLSNYGKEGENSPFYSKKVKKEALAKEMATVINTEVNTSFQKLIDYLKTDYKQQSPRTLSEKKDYYRALVRYHTTMDVTPEEVHETGQEAVRKLQERMKTVRESLKFEGTQEEFHKNLKSDPQFIPKTPEEIGEKLLSFDRRIQPKIPEYFSLKPKAPHAVSRLDPKLEGSMTFGYYQVPTKSDPKGTYYYNGSNLSERPMFNSGSLVYHELVPGHHFQLNLQSENESLPAFRREGGHTAFVEGWAEYSSGLAEEMGMYQDPYELYGRLTAEMFLTVRLVVDTGMNYFDWPREKAMQFMRANLLESETQIHTESLRYCCDIPGQALGYKMGSFKIRALREKTQQALKEKYDVRKFHAAVLESGSMPLTVLEKHIEWVIESAE
ncbi:DUF885 domain-containing protein [bacterium]|nr:DUF885 domain-containing protein [bacterium]MCI0603556.1 DUF885 domain-containing protein [bacterium]